jgi:hypothetical protein
MKGPLAAVFFGAICHAQSVIIVNSGSTNTPGFEIAVDPSGASQYTAHSLRRTIERGEPPKSMHKDLPKALAKALYDDIKAAGTLSSLPPQRCMKSASFGTRLTVQNGNDISPDLSCGDGGDAKMRALIRDTNAIVQKFGSP